MRSKTLDPQRPKPGDDPQAHLPVAFVSPLFMTEPYLSLCPGATRMITIGSSPLNP